MLAKQLDFFEACFEEMDQPLGKVGIRLLDLDQYDRIIVSDSGGKDSTACLLHLLNLGVPKSKLELWHQCIDGGPEEESFFDWPVTESYLKAFSQALEIPVYFMWREGGIKGELYRENRMSLGVKFVRSEEVYLPTLAGKVSTRRRFPAKVASLMTRWCSGNAKIDVFRRVLTNAEEFKNGRFLVITGERREESAARSRYLETELENANTRARLAHRWRPVIDFTEERVWSLYAQYGIQPHPAYHLGFSRCSCMCCIFSGPDHWATIRDIDPERFQLLEEIERELNHTIDSKRTLGQMADKGRSLVESYPESAAWISKAMNGEFRPEDIFVSGTWNAPVGAFKGNGGGAI